MKRQEKMAFMWVFAKMQTSASLTELGSWFAKLCVLAMSQETPESIDLRPTPAEPDDEDSIHEPLPEPRQTLRTRTSFGRHFDDIATRVEGQIGRDDSPISNAITAQHWCSTCWQPSCRWPHCGASSCM